MDNPGDDPIQASSDEAASDFLSSQGTLQSTSLNTTLEDVSEVQASNVDDQLQGNLTENRESAVNQEFCAENQELENFDTDIPNWEIEKTALTQANFNLNQELIDVKENLKTTSLQNKQLLAELSQNSREIIEATKQRRILETSRNEYSQRNIELESAVVRLRLEKEERDAAIVRLNKEKQMISLEVIATNDQLKQLSGEKAALLLTMETTQQERRTLAFEQERANADKDMQLETRRYLLREIAERDEKIIKQRLQMSSKDVEFVNERLVFERKIENFQLQIEELTEKLELSKNDGDNYLKRIEETERRFKSDISNLEAELRCQAEVANIHKNDLDEALQVAASLKDKVTSCEETLETAKSVLVEVQQELVTQREEFQANLAEKENCIEELKDELKKSNEMLKSKHAVHVNITEEELAKLSPAAAETAALLRGGHSYSSIIREHARLAGELAEARDIIKQLENDLHDICDDVRERAPLFLSQRNMLDASFDQNSALNSQLQEAEAERQKLLNERDAAKRELLFMRTELEKYQRDYARVTKQVHQLMFAAERAMHAADPDWNELDDEKLFTTIVQLQQRNIQLESDIEREKANATQIAMDTQDTERENLRKELKTAKEVEANLIEKASQLKSALDIVKSQSEHFQELIKDSVSATEARNCRLRAEEAVAKANVAELRAHRLEDYVKVLKEERDKREKLLNEKLEASEMAAASIRQTNTALEVTLEMQKKSASEMSRELQARQKHVDKMAKDIEKLLATDAKRAGQVEELSRKLVDIQDQASTARIEKRSLQDELNSSKSEATRMRLEVDSLQKVVQREQLLMSSLSEVTARLSRIEAEKQSYSNTQLEALRLERDSLKSTSARLSDQLTHTRNEGKIIQARLEHELISLRSILSEKEQQKAVVDHELLDLRSKLVSIQEQYTQNDTIGMTPDRLKRECQQLKNRVQFLENQLDEVKNSLREAEADRVKRFDEKTLVEKHSGVLEENLKTTQQMGAMERERLEAKIISYEKRTSELAESVKLLREDREAAKSELLNLQISSDQETQNLKRQFDVANLQLEDVRSQLNETKASMQELQAEIDRKTFEISQINETANELQGNLIDAEAKAESLNAQLDCKIMALAAAQDAVKQADEQRAAATATLATKDAERDSLIRENREKLAEYEQKLNEIVQQYEAVALLTSQSTLETSMNPAPEGQSRSDNSSTALVESLQTVLQFVREEKEKAMTRSMNAEVEMRRLRAETAEYERGRSELLVRIRDLETERAANSVALVERSRLMEQIESLSSVQRENAQLSAEKLRLTKELSEAQKQKSLSEGRLQQLTGELHQNKINFTNASAEIRNRRRENELLKQRLQSTNTSASAALQSEIEELKKQFNQKVQELEVANEHATKSEKAKMAAEEEVKKSEMKCSQTRALAVKYRDENKKLKESLGAASAGIVTETSPEMEELKKTNDELNKKISALEKTSNDLEMNQIRMNMLETRMAKLNNQLVEVTAERDNAKQSIERLEKELAQARARPVSTVSSEIHTTSAAPTASVSTSAASSAAKTLSAATSSSAASKFGQPSSAASSNSQSQQVSQVHNSSSAVPIFTDDRARVPTMPTDSVSQSLSDELLFNSQKPPLLTSTPSIPADIDQQAVGESVPELSHQQPAPPDVLSPATSLPVPGAFASSARVPAASLFSGFSHTPTQSEGVPTLPPKPTIAPPAEKPKISFASSSSLIQPGQSLFGRSAPTPEPMTTSSSSTDAVLLPEESVVEAGQSSQVSGSVDKTQHIQPLSGPSDSAGESRDSTTGPNVSSSEARRKRTATESSAGGAKRLRGSPSEDVTSSENRPIQQVDEIPELDDEVLEIEQEVSDEDRNEILRRQLHGEVVDLENEDDEEGDNGEMLDDDGQMTGEEENEEPEDDESFGGDEEYEEPDDDDDIIDETDQPRDEEEDDIVVLNDSDDNDDVDSIEDVGEEEADDLRGNDDEVLGGEDSQPSLDDQDREAASAMEEAEDEGRASVEDQLAPTDGSVAVPLQPDVPNPNLRIPQFFETDGDREDQCSSSNETAEASGSSEPAQRGRQVARRSRGRQLQIYQPPNRSVAPQSPARSRGSPRGNRGIKRGGRGRGTHL